MNTFLWILAGAGVGWLGYTYFGFNEARGKTVSMIIGAAGGFVGGHLIAPMFTAAPVPGDLNTAALFFAAAVAAGFLAVGNLIHNRWDV